MATGTPTTAVEYPESDGEPMAETPIHVEAILLLHQALQDFFHGREDVFVASDIFWYWQEGNKEVSISPDVMVVPGVRPRDLADRRSFKSWEEGGAVPAAVFEMASQGTWRKDRFDKLRTYESLEVAEYFMFDPEARFVVPPLIGFRLRNGVYTPIDEVEPDTLPSDLGFRLRPEGRMLRLINARTGQPIPTRQERAEQADVERLRADAERERADALQAEVARLRARLKQLGDTDGNGP